MKVQVPMGFDLGSTIGVSLLNETGDVAWVKTHTMTGEQGERFYEFFTYVSRLLLKYHDEAVVVFEDVNFNRGFSYIPGQKAILLALCEQHRIPYVGVGVKELKKYATGNGNAKKKAMIAAAEGWINRTPNEHEADAIMVARWGWHHALPDTAVP